MGLHVFIYRSDLGGSTNGGISKDAKGLCVVNMDGPFDPSDSYPAALLGQNALGDPIIVPAELKLGHVGPIFGGNFAATSDGRFSEAILKLIGTRFYGALPIHDRFETPAEAEMLSR